MPVLKIKKNGQWVEVWGATSGSSGGAPAARQSSVTVTADAWVGESSPYSQVVTINGADENSAIDIKLTPEQVDELSSSRTAFMAINNDGIITVYAIGNKPTLDYTMCVEITHTIIV